MSNEFNGDSNEYNRGVPESASYSELHSTAELHSTSETHSYSEFGDTGKRNAPPKTMVTSRGMNEALQYSSQVAAVIKAVAVVSVVAVVAIVPILDVGMGVDFEYFELKSEDTMIHYYVMVADYNEDMDLTITIHNYFFSKTMSFEGDYASGTVTGLQPHMEYTATIKDGNRTIGERTIWTKTSSEMEEKLAITGVHLEGTDRNKLFLDMECQDPHGVILIGTVDVMVNANLYGTGCTIYDLGANPYVLLDVGKEISSSSDDIDLTLSYSRYSYDDGEYVPQDDLVFEDLHVAYVEPVFQSVGQFERMSVGRSASPVESKLTFKFNVDDPDSHWSDFTVSGYYYIKDEPSVQNAITFGESHFTEESDGIFGAVMVPNTVPSYNAAICMTLSCTQSNADGTTSMATLATDVAVPTVFFEMLESTQYPGDYTYGGTGNPVRLEVVELIGLEDTESIYIDFSYYVLSGGAEVSTAKPTGSSSFSGLGIVEIDSDMAEGYEGHGYLTFKLGSSMLVSEAYIPAIYIMSG